MRVIKKQLVKRCLDMMFDIAKKGEEEYEKFWSQFGRSIKLGIVDDQENKAKLSKLLRVRSRLSDWSMLPAAYRLEHIGLLAQFDAHCAY